MGDFISRGIAIGFAVGVTAALFARRYPLTKGHPNLIGFAVAGTADAISRDYRRPTIYERLLKLDSPLGSRARGMLLAIRTGSEEQPPTEIKAARDPYLPKPRTYTDVSTKPDLPSSTNPNEVVDAPPTWWEAAPQDSEESTPSGVQDDTSSVNAYPYPPVQLPPGGPFKGTKTWDDIRRQGGSGV